MDEYERSRPPLVDRGAGIVVLPRVVPKLSRRRFLPGTVAFRWVVSTLGFCLQLPVRRTQRSGQLLMEAASVNPAWSRWSGSSAT